MLTVLCLEPLATLLLAEDRCELLSEHFLFQQNIVHADYQVAVRLSPFS